MGYYSDTAYAIVFLCTEDRDKIIARLPADQWALIKDEVRVEDDRILFHDPFVKWGYDDIAYIAAHKALLAAAQEAHDEYGYHEGDATDNPGVFSLGVLMRLGEDSDDFERDVWGDDEEPGMPNWYDLVDERRELTVSWKE